MFIIYKNPIFVKVNKTHQKFSIYNNIYNKNMEKLLKLSEVAEILNVSKNTLRNWDNSGKLPSVRTCGNQRRYKQSDINNFINHN